MHEQKVEAVIISREEREAQRRASNRGTGLILWVTWIVMFFYTAGFIGP